jgi:predicted CopG family antitoxin
MVSRHLALREDVYKKLLEAKKGNESFSDVIERLLEERDDLLAYAGVFTTDKEFENVEKDIALVRQNSVPQS